MRRAGRQAPGGGAMRQAGRLRHRTALGTNAPARSSWRAVARAVVPRRVRNWLRSPRQAVRWVVNEWRGPIDFRIRDDWTFRCPRNAAERAFHLQLQDPPQVREFDDFVAEMKSAGRVVLLD